MDASAAVHGARRPRFRRASEPPAFRLTEDDVEIVRQVGRHRLIRSTHIAALIGRSQDRTNDRLLRLFHAGYVDRPRSQLDYYPTAGSAPMIYALANRGARLLRERDGITFANSELSRKNREAGRPFIEHQVEIVNFRVALEHATYDRRDVRFVAPEELSEATRQPRRAPSDAFALRARISSRGRSRESAVIPDLVFGLAFAEGSRRYFMVEIDRGTMPVQRSDPSQTSFERKMRTYLAAYASKQHTRNFGWQSFRVLTVTTDDDRRQSMMEGLRGIVGHGGVGPSLFWFSTFASLRQTDPLAHEWRDGNNGIVRLV